MGILDDLVYSLRRASKGQTQQLPSIRDQQLYEQMQAAVGQNDQAQALAPQQMPQGLLEAMAQHQSSIPVDQATFSGKKKFKSK